MGNERFDVAFRSSTMPSRRSKVTEVMVRDGLAQGVASMSRDARMEVSDGVLLGRR